MGMLEIKDLAERFCCFKTLWNVNLSLTKNTCRLIIGPNQACSSTLLSCLIGKVTPDSDSVIFDGTSVLGVLLKESISLAYSAYFRHRKSFLIRVSWRK